MNNKKMFHQKLIEPLVCLNGKKLEETMLPQNNQRTNIQSGDTPNDWRSIEKQPRPWQPHVGQSRTVEPHAVQSCAGQPHDVEPHIGPPYAWQSHARQTRAVQPHAGQILSVQSHARALNAAQSSVGQPHAGQSNRVQPRAVQAFTGQLHDGQINNGQLLVGKPENQWEKQPSQEVLNNTLRLRFFQQEFYGETEQSHGALPHTAELRAVPQYVGHSRVMQPYAGQPHVLQPRAVQSQVEKLPSQEDLNNTRPQSFFQQEFYGETEQSRGTLPHTAELRAVQTRAVQQHAGNPRAIESYVGQPHVVQPRAEQAQVGKLCAKKPHVGKPRKKQPPQAVLMEMLPFNFFQEEINDGVENEQPCAIPSHGAQPNTGQAHVAEEPSEELLINMLPINFFQEEYDEEAEDLQPHAGQPHADQPSPEVPRAVQAYTVQLHDGQINVGQLLAEKPENPWEKQQSQGVLNNTLRLSFFQQEFYGETEQSHGALPQTTELRAAQTRAVPQYTCQPHVLEPRAEQPQVGKLCAEKPHVGKPCEKQPSQAVLMEMLPFNFFQEEINDGVENEQACAIPSHGAQPNSGQAHVSEQPSEELLINMLPINFLQEEYDEEAEDLQPHAGQQSADRTSPEVLNNMLQFNFIQPEFDETENQQPHVRQSHAALARAGEPQEIQVHGALPRANQSNEEQSNAWKEQGTQSRAEQLSPELLIEMLPFNFFCQQEFDDAVQPHAAQAQGSQLHEAPSSTAQPPQEVLLEMLPINFFCQQEFDYDTEGVQPRPEPKHEVQIPRESLLHAVQSHSEEPQAELEHRSEQLHAEEPQAARAHRVHPLQEELINLLPYNFFCQQEFDDDTEEDTLILAIHALTEGLNSNDTTPMTIEEINQLQKVQIADNKREMNCAICMNSLEDENVFFKIACEHKFHVKCLTRWLFVNPTCPVCRTNCREWSI